MELVANFKLNNEALNAEFDISEIQNFDTLFQIECVPDISHLATKTELQTEITNLDEQLTSQINTKVTDVQGSGVIQASRVDNIITIKSTTFVFEQGIASSVWEIEHNLNKKPSITVVDSADSVIGIFKADYDGPNKVILQFNGEFTGKAYLN